MNSDFSLWCSAFENGGRTLETVAPFCLSQLLYAFSMSNGAEDQGIAVVYYWPSDQQTHALFESRCYSKAYFSSVLVAFAAQEVGPQI
jgi:hypothetical protein